MKMALPPTGTDIMIRLITLYFVSSGTSCSSKNDSLFVSFFPVFPVRSVVGFVLLGMVRGSIFQDAASVARVLRHFAVAGRHLDRHDIAAVVGTRGTEFLRHRGYELAVGATALQKLLAGLQLLANHVGQRLEVAKQNGLDNQLAVQHLHILGLHVAPSVDFLHVIGDTVILGHGTLLFGVHHGSNLLHR